MGGAVSSGRNNDDLVDNLLEADYIKSSRIERVFRAVDRAEYFLPEARSHAYKDLAWKSDNLHISAPCIYSEVMEGLSLYSGASFLNLGSGTGYLSTMVGLILGSNGVNHGVEFYEDVIEYANKKLDDFKKFSGAIDEFDFCEPKFIQGNCLSLSNDCSGLYDRIYCGAACPDEFKDYMKDLLKIGGILVMPINDQLLQTRRTEKAIWATKTLLPVSFASLIMPVEGCREVVKRIEVEPQSLQVICRTAVRNLLRMNIEMNHPPVKKSMPNKITKKKRALKRLVVPIFDDDSSDDERRIRLGGERNRDGRAMFMRGDADGIFSFFLGMGNRRGSGERDRPSSAGRKSRGSSLSTQDGTETENSINEEQQQDASNSSSQQVRAVIEHYSDSANGSGRCRHEGRRENCLGAIGEISEVIVNCLDRLTNESNEGQPEEENHNDCNENKENRQTESENAKAANAEDDSDSDIVSPPTRPSTSSSASQRRSAKREKFDSGLGDEIVEAQDSSDDEHMKLDAISSCDEDYSAEKRHKRGSSSDSEDELKCTEDQMRMYESPYTMYMQQRIQQLPLPLILKRYLNYYREFKTEE